MNAYTPHDRATELPGQAPSALTDVARERHQDEAQAALARFREQWPVERTRDMAAYLNGTPAERDAAAMRIAARAIERTRAETPADDAVRSLVGRLTDEQLTAHSVNQRKFGRENRRAGGRS